MTEFPHLDAAIDDLGDGAAVWTVLTVAQRARLLERLHETVSAAAEQWADAAADAKRLDDASPLRGEEWLTGPYTTLVALDAYRRTLDAIAARRSPLHGMPLDEAPGGRVRAHVFPATASDRVLLSGFRGEVWFEPGVKRREAIADAGLAQLDPQRSGGIALVLGAGNVTSIPVLDVLYELLAHNRVSLLKLNPTQEALLPILERALAPLVAPGLLRIVAGGPDVGAYLARHTAIGHVHVTGSATTFDAIVRDADAARRRVPITAELGGVSPVIVVPGAWTDADLRFQAEHVATMRLQNSGHNCVAAQVVVLSADWPQRDAFLTELRRALDAAPARPVWYPGAAERVEAAATRPGAERHGDGARVLVTGAPLGDLATTELFAPVLGVTELPGTGRAFLDAAVAYANDELAGTLGANVLVDPDTQRALGEGFEEALADLRYGGIAVNAWTGVSFTIAQLPWGAFPGGTPSDVGSGIGVVHNALLLDRVERSVLYGPFRPFPRSLGARGGFTALPKPPWFVTARTGAEVSAGLTRYRVSGSIPGLVRTLAAAFRA